MIGLFAYPWDILDRGPELFIDECCSLGVDQIHATTLYHSGKFLLPRSRTSKVYFPESGRLFVDVPDDAFTGKLRPGRSAIATTGWWERLSSSASRAGVNVAAWTVFHHSSALASEHPELAIHNLFGDVYPFALCPSHEAVRQYSVSLASAIHDLGVFGTLDIETIGYLGYHHGHHHEVSAVPTGPLETFLLSICFCPACCEAGDRAAIPMAELRSQLQQLLMAKWNVDDSAGKNPDNLEQLLTLIAMSEPLQRLIRLRLQTVTGLVQDIRAATGGTRLGLFTSSFAGSPSNIWMEGIALPELRSAVDSFHLLAYSADSEAVNSDLTFCLHQVEDPARLNLTLNLGLPITPTLNHAMAKIDFAWRLGVRSFSFFNYGFLGSGRLQWLREIADDLKSREIQ